MSLRNLKKLEEITEESGKKEEETQEKNKMYR